MLSQATIRSQPQPLAGALGVFVRAKHLALLAAGLLIFAAGCARNRVRAAAPTTAPPQPAAQLPTTLPETTQPATTTPPTTQPSQTAPPPTNPPADATPPVTQPETPPKHVAPPKKTEADAPRPRAPQILPQMSAADQAQLEKEAVQFTSEAEKNLHRTDGRALNAAQKDMADKIRGFLTESKGAAKTADWTRARNLSQKAYLLSVELANSL